MKDRALGAFDDFEIEPLSDEALESVAGGKSSDGDTCCSCKCCSNKTDTSCPEETSTQLEPAT